MHSLEFEFVIPFPPASHRGQVGEGRVSSSHLKYPVHFPSQLAMGCKVSGGPGQGWGPAHDRCLPTVEFRDVVASHLCVAAASGGVCRLQLLLLQNCDVVNSIVWSSPGAVKGVIDRG